jgi:hypothetical protein
MKLAKLIEFLRDRLKTVIWLSCAVLALVVLLDAIPAVVDKEHAHTGPEHWPAFWAVFGFLGCVVIVLFSKWFGHLGIMTREDYYEDGPSASQEPQLQATGVRPSPGAATSESNRFSNHSSAPDKSNPAAPGDGRTPKGGHHE